ncbi:MAG: M48 family metalloprotease [Candidatus Wallbacteria bacterium]|nr:M48 family metalloprotease [Candidatus Wallbacteria bacterium]
MNRRMALALLTVLPAWLIIELCFWPHPQGASEMLARLGAGPYTTASAYCRTRYGWFALACGAQLALWLALASPLVSRAFEAAVARFSPVARAAAIALACTALARSLSLTFGFASGHLLDRAYGLTRQSTWAWLTEQLLEHALAASVTVAAAAAVIWAAGRFGRGWWLVSTAVLSAGTLALVAAQPLLIDPLFDRYIPLQGTPGSERLMELARRAGFDPARLSVALVSHRTTKGNAFVNGLGPTERIALWDTFLEASRADEAELVLAHELGHWRAGHVALGTALALVGLALAMMLFSALFPVPTPRDVPAILLTVFILRVACLPVENAVSRAIEAQADFLSLRYTNRAEAFIRAEEQLARQNLSDPDPPPLAVWLLFTHPPTSERIAMAQRFARAGSR